MAKKRPRTRYQAQQKILGAVGVTPGTRLYRVWVELRRLREGFHMPGCSVVREPGKPSFTPFPQRPPGRLVLDMVGARPEEWNGILANELLLYLKRAHVAGHPKASADALRWCLARHLVVPDWVRDAPHAPARKRRGKRSSETRRRTFWVDLTRYVVGERLALPAERLKGESKYAHAKRLIGPTSWIATPDNDKGSTRGIEKSYEKIRNLMNYYFDPELVMEILQRQAPTIYKLLS